MASKRGGVQRVLGKLQKSIEEGQYYEAHQMYRTLYFRYNAQKKYAEAIDLLYNGATLLLQKNQHSSGTDLALLLVEVLQNSAAEPNSANIDKVCSLHRQIDDNSIDRPTLVASAIKWSAKQEEFKFGHPELHKKLGITLWKEKNFTEARYHFLHSSDGNGCATMLIEFHITSGYASEVDLFIAQAVLQYLCLRNKSTAEEAFSTFTRQHPQVEDGPPFVRPLLNFVWLLLLAVEGGKVAVFTVLCEQYQPSLKRDPSYIEYLDRIGQVFFGMPPPKQSSQGGMFGNLLQSLFNFDEDDDSDTEGTAPGPSQNSAPAASNNTVRELTSEDLD